MGVLGGYLYWKVFLEFWFGHPKCHFQYPPKRPKWPIFSVLALNCKSLPSIFQPSKRQLLYIHPIGRSVGWCHHYFSFSTYILRIRTTVRDFTWSSLVVNSGPHCDCEYCQEIVKIVPELAEKRKEKRIFRQRWFVWGQHNYHTSCRWSVLIKKTFFKTKVSAVNMIRGIDF